MSSNNELRCSFCDKEFKSKSSLDFHQKNTKSCLEKQGKINDNYKCQHCNKILSTLTRLNTHIDVCKVKLNKKNEEKEDYIKSLEKENKENKENKEMLNKMNEEKNEYIKRIEKENKDYKDILKRNEEKDEYIKRIEKENEEYKMKLKENEVKLKEKQQYILKLEEMLEKRTNSIIEIAKQPKNITTTNTNSNNSRIKTQNNTQNNNFDINDIQKITQVLENHLTPEVLSKGQKGVAQMLKDHLLQTDTGNLLYECTDTSRQKFEFKNKHGILEIDSKATKLLKSLNDANIYDKTQTTCQKLWEKEDGSVDRLAQTAYMPKVIEVLEINSDSSKLRSHLASITCK